MWLPNEYRISVNYRSSIYETNSLGTSQHLGRFTFTRMTRPIASGGNTSINTCSRPLAMTDGEHDMKVWQRETLEMSTLQVDVFGKYACGFLSKRIFIYDIAGSSVRDLNCTDIFSASNIVPQALDIGETVGQIPIAILASYTQFDVGKALPILYLIRLNSPYNMTLVDSYTMTSYDQRFVRWKDASTYRFKFPHVGLQIFFHSTSDCRYSALTTNLSVCIQSVKATTDQYIQSISTIDELVRWRRHPSWSPAQQC